MSNITDAVTRYKSNNLISPQTVIDSADNLTAALASATYAATLNDMIAAKKIVLNIQDTAAKLLASSNYTNLAKANSVTVAGTTNTIVASDAAKLGVLNGFTLATGSTLFVFDTAVNMSTNIANILKTASSIQIADTTTSTVLLNTVKQILTPLYASTAVAPNLKTFISLATTSTDIDQMFGPMANPPKSLTTIIAKNAAQIRLDNLFLGTVNGLSSVGSSSGGIDRGLVNIDSTTDKGAVYAIIQTKNINIDSALIDNLNILKNSNNATSFNSAKNLIEMNYGIIFYYFFDTALKIDGVTPTNNMGIQFNYNYSAANGLIFNQNVIANTAVTLKAPQITSFFNKLKWGVVNAYADKDVSGVFDASVITSSAGNNVYKININSTNSNSVPDITPYIKAISSAQTVQEFDLAYISLKNYGQNNNFNISLSYQTDLLVDISGDGAADRNIEIPLNYESPKSATQTTVDISPNNVLNCTIGIFKTFINQIENSAKVGATTLINISDSGTISLTGLEISKNIDALKILNGTNFAINGTDVLAVDAIVISNINNFKITISDTTSNLISKYDNLSSLVASGKILSVKIIGDNIISVSDTHKLAAWKDIITNTNATKITIIDTINNFKNIGDDYTAIKATAKIIQDNVANLQNSSNIVGNFIAADTATNLLTLTTASATNIVFLAKVSSVKIINPTDGTSNQVSFAQAKALAALPGFTVPNGNSLSINDTAANITSNLAAISALITSGKVTGLTSSDGDVFIKDTVANISGYLPVLNALAVSGSLANVTSTDNKPLIGNYALLYPNRDFIYYNKSLPTPLTIILSDTAALYTSGAGNLEDAYTRGVSSFQVSDSNPITVTTDAYIRNIDFFNNITNSYKLILSDAMTADEALTFTPTSTVKQLTLSIADTADNIIGNLDALQALTKRATISGISFTDTFSQLSLTLPQLVADKDIFALIAKTSSKYSLTINNLKLSELAATVTTYNPAKVTIADTAANIVANLAALNTLAGSGKLASIQISDNNPLLLSDTQIQSNTSLWKANWIGNADIKATNIKIASITSLQSIIPLGSNLSLLSASVLDTAALVAANLNLLSSDAPNSLEALVSTGLVSSIALSDTAPLVITTRDNFFDNQEAINAITGNFSLKLAGLQIADVAALTFPTRVSYTVGISDTTANLKDSIDFIETLAKAKKITVLNLIDGGKSNPLDITEQQYKADIDVINMLAKTPSRINGDSYNLSISNVLAADAYLLSTISNIHSVYVSDTSVNIARNILSLQKTAIISGTFPAPDGKRTILRQIDASDNAPIALTDSQFLALKDLVKINFSENTQFSLFNVKGSNLSALQTLITTANNSSLSVGSVSMSDTAANLTKYVMAPATSPNTVVTLPTPSLLPLITSMTVSDNGTFSLTKAQILNNKGLLKQITSAYGLVQTDAKATATITTPTSFAITEIKDLITQLTLPNKTQTLARLSVGIGDTAQSLQANMDYLETLAKARFITAINFIDRSTGSEVKQTSVALTITAAQLTADIDALKLIAWPAAKKINVTNATIASLTAVTATLKSLVGDGNFTYTVTDTAKNIAAAIDTVLNPAAISGKLTNLTVSDGLTNPLTIKASQYDADQKTLSAITKPYTLSLTSVLAKDVARYSAIQEVVGIYISDTAANILANWSAINNALVDVKSVILTDKISPVLSATDAAFIKTLPGFQSNVQISVNATKPTLTAVAAWSPVASLTTYQDVVIGQTLVEASTTSSLNGDQIFVVTATEDYISYNVNGSNKLNLFLISQNRIGEFRIEDSYNHGEALSQSWIVGNQAVTTSFVFGVKAGSEIVNGGAIWLDLGTADSTNYSLKYRNFEMVPYNSNLTDNIKGKVSTSTDIRSLISNIPSQNIDWHAANTADGFMFAYTTLSANSTTKIIHIGFFDTAGNSKGTQEVEMSSDSIWKLMSKTETNEFTLVYSNSTKGNLIFYTQKYNDNYEINETKELSGGLNSISGNNFTALNFIAVNFNLIDSETFDSTVSAITGVSNSKNYIKFICDNFYPVNKNEFLIPLNNQAVNLIGIPSYDAKKSSAIFGYQDGDIIHVTSIDSKGRLISDYTQKIASGSNLKGISSLGDGRYEINWIEPVADKSSLATTLKGAIIDSRTGPIQSVPTQLVGSATTPSIIAGTAFNDTITVNAANSIVEGGRGADKLTASTSATNSTLSYEHSISGVNVNLATSTVSGGDAQGDTISGFNNIIASQFNDTLIGNANDNIFYMQRGNKVIDGGGGKDILVWEAAEFNGDYTDGFRNDNGVITLSDTRADGLFKNITISNISALVTPYSIHIINFNLPYAKINNGFVAFYNDYVDGVYQPKNDTNNPDKILYNIHVQFDVLNKIFDTTFYAQKIMNSTNAAQFNDVIQEIVKLGAQVNFEQIIVAGADINGDAFIDKNIRSGLSYDPNTDLSSDGKTINFNVKQGWMHFNLKQIFLKVQSGITNAWISGTNDTQSGNVYYANGNDNGYFTASLNSIGSYKITKVDMNYLSDLSNAKTVADFNDKYNAAQAYFSAHTSDFNFNLGYYVDLKWANHTDINGDGVADDSLGFGVNYNPPSANDTSITMSLQPYNPPVKNYTIHDIGLLPGYANSIAKAVSNDGSTVVGWAYNAGGTEGHAFVYNKTGMHDIGALGGNFSIATGVSFDGSVVVGSFHTASGQEHGFYYKNGIMHDIGTILHPNVNDNYFSRVQGVSADGRYIVGASSIFGSNENHAFKYDTYTQKFIDLGAVAGFNSAAFASNLDGSVIAGQIHTSATGTVHAAVFKDGKIIDLGIPSAGYDLSVGISISDDGKVISGLSIKYDPVEYSQTHNYKILNSVGFIATLNDQGNYITKEIGNTTSSDWVQSFSGVASYGSYIVGGPYNSGSTAYIYDNKTYKDLGALGYGFISSGAFDISLNGNVIVGGSSKDSSANFGATISKPDNTHAVVWTTSDVTVGPYVSPGPPAPLASNQFYNPVNGHVYEFVTSQLLIPGINSWGQSYNEAHSKKYYNSNGYLATITSQNEFDFVYNHLPSYSDVYFTSGHLVSDSTYSTNKWAWTDGPEKGNIFWDNGPVNNQYSDWYSSYGYPFNGQTCMSIFSIEKFVSFDDFYQHFSIINYIVEYSDFASFSSSVATQSAQFIQATAAMAGATASGNIASAASLQDQQSLLITTKPV